MKSTRAPAFDSPRESSRSHWVLFSWGTWALVAALFLAALLNLTAHTWKERLVFAPLALTLGVLALIVARSPRP